MMGGRASKGQGDSMRRAVSVGTIVALLALAGAAYAAVITCQGGLCQGTEEPDTITGSLTPDNIFADAGADDVDARAGHDFARGAEGQDTLDGGRGEDTLRGNQDGDVIEGGPADDNIFGHANPDEEPTAGVTPLGEPTPPSERLTDTDSGDQDAVYGGPGFELIDVEDGDGDDYVDCGPDGANVDQDAGDKLENCPISPVSSR
jgi:Ca2+-binding RTX toxin-like protein